MSDQELRDKLASEGIISKMTGELVPRWHQADFKAGWDAARANENKIILKPETGGTYTVYAKLTTTAEAERDRLKAQCEKLAEALAHLYECELQEWGKEEWEVDEKDTSALGKAKQVLAEYRKSQK